MSQSEAAEMLSQQYDDRQEYVRGHSPKIVVNGDVYDGEYKDGIRHGRGIYRFASGALYDGEYRLGKKHGRGTFIYSDGSKYSGEWLDDKREGFGEYFYTNGDHYTGEWRNHVRHGRGRYTYASAAIQYDGNWNNGFRTDDDDRHLEQHQTDAVGAVVSSAAETGENRREIEEDSQTLTDEDATTHAVEEDATAAAATVTEEVGSVNADREFSATDKKFAGELAASAAERSAEPEQTDDDPRTTVTNEATGADADDGTSAAAVRTSSDVASAMLASAAAVDAMQIQHRVLGIEQQPADRMETGSNDQAIASDERKRALVDEEIIVEQHNDRDGERSDEHVAETEREPSSVEGNKKQAVEEHEMPVDESTLAETESHELPSDEQRKPAEGQFQEHQGSQVEGREIQTEYSTASSARRHDVTKDDNDASSSKQTGSVEKALTSSAQHVTPISEQPTTLDERVIPPEAEINATPTEEQAIGGATSDGADALRQASVELQTLNHDSEKVSAAIDEMSEHANGPRLSLNGDVSSTRDEEGLNAMFRSR